MCSPVQCRDCGKMTWTGCGNHVEQALRGVPHNNRCEGHIKQPGEGGFFSKLLGR